MEKNIYIVQKSTVSILFHIFADFDIIIQIYQFKNIDITSFIRGVLNQECESLHKI